jgi:hypothetical protein
MITNVSDFAKLRLSGKQYFAFYLQMRKNKTLTPGCKWIASQTGANLPLMLF